MGLTMATTPSKTKPGKDRDPEWSLALDTGAAAAQLRRLLGVEGSSAL